MRLAPVPITLLIAFMAIYMNHFANLSRMQPAALQSCRAKFNYTFPIDAIETNAKRLANRSGEHDIAVEALLEYLDPDLTVFAAVPFPADKVPSVPSLLPGALEWVKPTIRTDGAATLHEHKAEALDLGTLGISAILLGQNLPVYLSAATRHKDYLLSKVRRRDNGAISRGDQQADLAANTVSTLPTFLAYYAVVSNDMDCMRLAVEQCRLYKEVLGIDSGPKQGLWKNAEGATDIADDNVWSTGSALAAYGMARVRATLSGWRPSNEIMTREMRTLDIYIHDMIEGTMLNDDDKSGLLRNYLGDHDWFGETSGTALIAATVYRMAVLHQSAFASDRYLRWADRKRDAVFSRVGDDGYAWPAVNPLDHRSREPVKESSEGQSCLLILSSAWRDCVCAGICR